MIFLLCRLDFFQLSTQRPGFRKTRNEPFKKKQWFQNHFQTTFQNPNPSRRLKIKINKNNQLINSIHTIRLKRRPKYFLIILIFGRKYSGRYRNFKTRTDRRNTGNQIRAKSRQTAATAQKQTTTGAAKIEDNL
ncbi:hypothetical protein HMPREF2907_09340 [Neisseria sp. HMSC055H02]|nr:hypothetical protein HMPREF2907_09340 [Neisseria sp. HMSC055H02]